MVGPRPCAEVADAAVFQRVASTVPPACKQTLVVLSAEYAQRAGGFCRPEQRRLTTMARPQTPPTVLVG
eukprot:5127376-Lingulodinium_polyedra.AAC.1